jgi:transposase-like protein
MDRQSSDFGPQETETQALQGIAEPRIGRRRAFTLAQKRRVVDECARRGNVYAVARHYRLAPSMIFRWRRLIADGRLGGTATDPE